jgi:hypothetical protein
MTQMAPAICVRTRERVVLSLFFWVLLWNEALQQKL